MKRFKAVLAGVVMLCGVLVVACWAGEETFGSVGLQVVPTINGDLVVLNVLQGTPAAGKGMLPGDLIFQVDDFTLKGSEFGKVVSEYLWGPVGSSVELFYRRPGIAGVNRVVLQRTTIEPRLTVTPTMKQGVPDSKGSQ